MNQKKSLNFWMRKLHRDIGYLMIGFVIIYSLSGIVLTYRNTNLFKHNVIIERQLTPGLNPSELANMLRMRDMRSSETKGDTVFFNNGYYNSTTGLAVYSVMEVIPPIDKFIVIHKTSSENTIHLINIIFSVLLLFLAISSLWMYKRKSAYFRRGLILAIIGVIIAILLVYLQPK